MMLTYLHMIINIFIILTISAVPFEPKMRELYIDTLELNHLYDEDGDINSDQFILWKRFAQSDDAYPYYSMMLSWRGINWETKAKYKQMGKRYCPPFVYKIPIGKNSIVIPFNNYNVHDVLVRIRFKAFIETHTQYDPEQEAKNKLDYLFDELHFSYHLKEFFDVPLNDYEKGLKGILP